MNIPSVNQPYPGAAASRPAAAVAAKPNVRSKETAPAEISADSAAPASEERLTLDQTESLQRAMNSCPDTRADVIARGKALAADPNYPSKAVVAKLSRLFVADTLHHASEDAA